jgi:chromosome partitioning protein
VAEIIAIVSHKGGTGKTSLVQNLAHELAGQRVLIVDMDPQANLTLACRFDPGANHPTIFHALQQPEETLRALVHLPHFDLLPANLDLALAEMLFANAPDRNDKLKDALAPVAGRYDYILIDGPPSMGFYAFNALTAASAAIVPVQCQPFAYRGMDSTLQLIQLVQQTNPTLRLQGIVLTLYDKRLSLTRSVETMIRNRFGKLVAQTVIPLNVAIAEATLDGVSVAEYAPHSAGAHAYSALAKELLNA